MKSRALSLLIGLLSCLTSPAAELWLTPTHRLPTIGRGAWPTTQTAEAAFSFAVPETFEGLKGARLLVLSEQTTMKSFDIFLGVSQDGLLQDAFTLSTRGVPLSLSAGVITEVDLTSFFTGRLSELAGGRDYVSVLFRLSEPRSEPPSARVLGLKILFDEMQAPPVQGGLVGYEIISQTFNVTLSGNGRGTRSVPCPAGKVPISGGCQTETGEATLASIFAAPPSSWACGWRNPATVPMSIRATVSAVCVARGE